MNIYLLQLVSKWIGIFAVSLISIVPGYKASEQQFLVNNNLKDLSLNVVTKIINHDTRYTYSSSLPKGKQEVVVEGEDGLIYFSIDNNEEKQVKQMVTEVINVGTGPLGEYNGTLTGYGPDCPGCSAAGNVSCKTREKTNHSLTYDGITYNDKIYGEVRILAATRELFPCGTIVLVDNGVLEPFYGIVLDTGSTMRNAWTSEKKVWMDLAFESQGSVKNATSRNTNFKVQRWGW